MIVFLIAPQIPRTTSERICSGHVKKLVDGAADRIADRIVVYVIPRTMSEYTYNIYTHTHTQARMHELTRTHTRIYACTLTYI